MTRERFRDLFFIFAITYILIIVIQLPLAIFYSIILHIENRQILGLIGNCCTLCLIISIQSFFPLSRLYCYLSKKTTVFSILLFNLLISCFLVAFFYKLHLHRFDEIGLYLFFAFAIMIYLNIVLYNQIGYIEKQKQRLIAYDEYFPVIDHLITQLRTRQHHHDNEIQSIISLMYTHKDYDSLTKAMSEYIDTLSEHQPPDYLLKMNMSLVSGFLYQKKRTAEKNGVEIHYHFHSYLLNSKVPEYILVELFGIMIDNAVEAVLPRGAVHIQISSTENSICFQTRNAGHQLTQDERTLFFSKGYSKKNSSVTGKHSGLGLYYLKELVLEKYQGNLSIYNIGTDIVIEIEI